MVYTLVVLRFFDTISNSFSIALMVWRSSRILTTWLMENLLSLMRAVGFTRNLIPFSANSTRISESFTDWTMPVAPFTYNNDFLLRKELNVCRWDTFSNSSDGSKIWTAAPFIRVPGSIWTRSPRQNGLVGEQKGKVFVETGLFRTEKASGL